MALRRLFEELRQDVQYALRGARSKWVTTATCLVILILGVGANTAIVQVLDAVAFRQLPIRGANQLVRVAAVKGDNRMSLSYPVFQELERQQSALGGIFASYDFDAEQVTLGSGEPFFGISSRLVTGRYFDVLHVPAAYGRTLVPDDDRPGAPGVAIISSGFWRRAFGSQPEAVGQTIRLNRVPLTIVGVTPAWFFGEHIGSSPDIWLPMSAASALSFGWVTQPSAAVVSTMGRLAEKSSIISAQASLDAVFQAVNRQLVPASDAQLSRLELESGARGRTGSAPQLTRALWLLSGTMVLVLFVGCCSIATILRSQGAARSREIRTRIALGATRWRVFKQLVTEASLLAIAGGALGLVVSRVGSAKLIALLAPPDSRFSLGLDWHVIAGALMLSMLTVLVFGVLPAYYATYRATGSALQLRDEVVAKRRGAAIANNAVIVAQVAVSLPLVTGALLLGKSFFNIVTQDLGFTPHQVVVVRLPFNPSSIALTVNRAKSEALYQAVNHSPGTLSAALVGAGPMDSMQKSGKISLMDAVISEPPLARLVSVSPGYFETMGIPVITGRGFTPNDRMGSKRVAVITETAGKRLFPGREAVGQLITVGDHFDATRSVEIIGTIKDLRFASPRDPFGVVVFQPILQAPAPLTSIVFRPATDPSTFVRTAYGVVKSAAPDVKISEVTTLSDLLEKLTLKERALAGLSAASGLLGLFLACIGLYGITSLRIRQSTQEIGVRIALGASPQRIERAFMRDIATMLAVGFILGALCVFTLSRFAQPLLFGVTASDARIFLAGLMTLTVATCGAGLIAVRSVVSLDPATAIRGETIR